MAITLTKASASPESLKYTYTFTGTSDTATRTLTQLLADCAGGPLKSLLAQVGAGLNAGVSGLTWATLPNSKLLSILTSFSGQSGADVPQAIVAFSGTSMTLQATASGGATFTGMIELRFRHSLQQ